MKLTAQKIGWITFFLALLVIVLFARNPVINLFDYFTGNPLRPGQGAQIVESEPYVLTSTQDTSAWATFSSPDGYSFKYPSDLVDVDTFLGFIDSKGDETNKGRFAFKVDHDSQPTDGIEAMQLISTGELKIQDITIRDISGKVITNSYVVSGTSIRIENFRFSLSNNRMLSFIVPLNYSPIDIPHSIISTLTLNK